MKQFKTLPLIIKYWHKKEKRMFYPTRIIFNLGGKREINNVQETIEPNPLLAINPKDLIPLRWIGLKDKKNKLIFEGDIVKYKFPIYGSIFGRIDDYECQNGLVRFNLFSARYEVEFAYCTRQFDHSLLQFECEIIGNVFENSDLLS